MEKMVDDADPFLALIEDLAVEFEDEVGMRLGVKGAKVAVDAERHKKAMAKLKMHRTASFTPDDEAAEKLPEEGQGAGQAGADSL